MHVSPCGLRRGTSGEMAVGELTVRQTDEGKTTLGKMAVGESTFSPKIVTIVAQKFVTKLRHFQSQLPNLQF